MSVHGQESWAEYLLPILNPVPRRKDPGWFVLGAFAGIPAPMAGVRAVAPNEIRDKAILEFQSTLRGLVDLWIESGKQVKGEQPWSRSVKHGQPQSIETTLVRFWRRNPPSVFFDGETQTIFTQRQSRHSDWIHLARQPESRVLAQARNYAIGLFAPLIDSPSRYRIFKCVECGVYFTRKRMPKRGVPIYGWSYCEGCESAASKRRVYDQRHERNAQMIKWAADSWMSNRPQSYATRVKRAVEKVNANLARNRDPIKKNWVSRHEKEIEAEVERRRNHAKS